jgi:hypothetical protein
MYVITFVAVAADRDQLPQELIADVIVGEMMDFRCRSLAAALADTEGAAQHQLPAPAPRLGLQILFVSLALHLLRDQNGTSSAISSFNERDVSGLGFLGLIAMEKYFSPLFV